MATFSASSLLGFDLPSIPTIMNSDERLDTEKINLKKSQLSIKLKNGEITLTQYNQLIQELDSKPVFNNGAIIPDNIQSIFSNPKAVTPQTVRGLVSLKPVLVQKQEIKKAKGLVKLVSFNRENIEVDIYDKSFSPRILNWVEPFDVSGFNKTLFYTDVDSGLKKGDRVFIINGNYDNDLLIKTDKYKKGRDGYKILDIDRCKIVLDINYTGVLPYNDDEVDDFIKVHYIRDRQELLQINRQITTRGASVSNKFEQYQNSIIYVDDLYSPLTTGWGDCNAITSAGFYVRDSSTNPANWIDITSSFIIGSFSIALSPTYSNNNRLKIINGSFNYNNKTFQEGYIYKWNIGPTQSEWMVDVTYHKPFITKANFRDGNFKGKWNTGLFGRQDKMIIWDGGDSKWQTGTLLNSFWTKGLINSKYTSKESFYSSFDENGIPFQKASQTNNDGKGYNFIYDSILQSSIINNGSIINSSLGTQSATYSVVENYLTSTLTTFTNKTNKGFFEGCYLNDVLIGNSEVSNSRAYNTRFVKSKIVNSKLTESFIKDSSVISDNIIKITDYDEYSATEFNPYANGASNKIYKFYISRSNYERLKNKDYFYIKGLIINNQSKEVLNFFDTKFTLSSWTENIDEINPATYSFCKRGIEYTAYLSTPLENSYKLTSVGAFGSYSTAITSENEKSGYSVDLIIKTIDTNSYALSHINFNRDLATSSVTSPTMSNYLGEIVDISNAYIVDSELESGLIETSNWINGNNISYNNDLNITIPTSLFPTTTLSGGYYNMSISSTSSSILSVTTTYDYSNPNSDDRSLEIGNIVYLNSVYYTVENYVTGITVSNPGTIYTSTSSVAVSGGAGTGLIVNIDAPLGTIDSIYINQPGIGYQIGDLVTIQDGSFDGIAQITSVTSSVTLLPSNYKVISNDFVGGLGLQELIVAGTTSVFNTLLPFGFFNTPGASNRYGYIYKSRFNKTKIKSGILRRTYITNSLIENDEYNVDDKDYSNLSRIRNLVIVDGLFKSNGNFLSNATYLYSNFVGGDNTWTNGIIQKSVINNMTFSNGVIKESRWVDGLFNSGTFYESRTFNGEPSQNEENFYTENTLSYYKDGITTATISNDRYSWQNGIFRLGSRNRASEFYKSDWENGTFESGKFYYSKWYNGLINGGIFGDSGIDTQDTVVYNATVSNVIVENASFYASDTSLQESTTNNIIWQNGIFNDGLFGTNYQQTTASNTATWYNGEFNGGQFVSLAKWKKGTFNGGKFTSGYGWTQSDSASASIYGWENGTFNGGEFGNAEGLTNSTWYYGEFNNGIFKGRVWNNGIFEKGEFQGSSKVSSVGGSSASAANSFVDSFRNSFYGLWRDGYFTDQKDKLIKDKKLYSKLERNEVSNLRRTYTPTKISNALWLNGTFSHQSGETNNIVWLNGTFDKGKFYASSFNPYVRRNVSPMYVWDYSTQNDLISNGSFTSSLGGWVAGSGNSSGKYSTFSLVSNQAYFIAESNAPALYLTNSSTSLAAGKYEITFDVVTFSSINNNLAVYVGNGGTTSTLLNPVTSGNIGTNKVEVNLLGGNLSLYVTTFGQTGSLTIDNLIVKISPTASFNIDDSCIWEDGNFENGDFFISKWNKGNFIIGTGYGMIWKTGVSNYMNAFNIFWEDGLWRNGNWYGSAFELGGNINDDFTKQILFRGMSWSGTSSCHIWNIFEYQSEGFEIFTTASTPFIDDSIDAPVSTPPPPPPPSPFPPPIPGPPMAVIFTP